MISKLAIWNTETVSLWLSCYIRTRVNEGHLISLNYTLRGECDRYRKLGMGSKKGSKIKRVNVLNDAIYQLYKRVF